MQYKMLNEVLEVAHALQPHAWGDGFKSITEALIVLLKEKEINNELTAKQKRVLNCLTTVCDGEVKRLKQSDRIKQININKPGFLNGYSSHL